jgi:hypothetical protein
MILVDVSWKDPGGSVRTVPARMEDTSPGGACLRVEEPIGVGSKLRIHGRREQFSGVTKYCRSDGQQYLVGIQRDRSSGASSLPASKIQVLAKSPEPTPSEIPIAAPEAAVVPTPEVSAALPGEPPNSETARGEAFPSQELRELPRTAPQTKRPLENKEAVKGKKPMRHKLLELAHWHNNKPENLNGSGNGTVAKENHAPPSAPPVEKIPASDAPAAVAAPQVELLPIEEVYQAAGIMNLRRGHSINRVVEMLRSEHIRGLSREMQRAAVLMALDAAGIPVDGILQDAKARQDALTSYANEQQKQLEAEWARKAEDNLQIQAELERIKANYMARINRNLEAVAREKAAFTTWRTTKQQECQNMSDAADLFSKPVVAETAQSALAEVSKVSGKSV